MKIMNKENKNLDLPNVKFCEQWATDSHANVNHLYDGKPYSTHLELVAYYGNKFAYLLNEDDVEDALASCWTHDTIEDCRKTYNDVKEICGENIADITYALTNEKGRTRKDRANDSYYRGIKNTPLAAFVKICDRLANAKYSKDSGSGMFKKYKQENKNFVSQLWVIELSEMFNELDKIFE